MIHDSELFVWWLWVNFYNMPDGVPDCIPTSAMNCLRKSMTVSTAYEINQWEVLAECMILVDNQTDVTHFLYLGWCLVAWKLWILKVTVNEEVGGTDRRMRSNCKKGQKSSLFKNGTWTLHSSKSQVLSKSHTVPLKETLQLKLIFCNKTYCVFWIGNLMQRYLVYFKLSFLISNHQIRCWRRLSDITLPCLT